MIRSAAPGSSTRAAITCPGRPSPGEGANTMTTEEARRFLQSVFDRAFWGGKAWRKIG